jgi:hypothetical protein
MPSASSRPIISLNPTTSAARIVVSLRSMPVMEWLLASASMAVPGGNTGSKGSADNCAELKWQAVGPVKHGRTSCSQDRESIGDLTR